MTWEKARYCGDVCLQGTRKTERVKDYKGKGVERRGRDDDEGEHLSSPRSNVEGGEKAEAQDEAQASGLATGSVSHGKGWRPVGWDMN